MGVRHQLRQSRCAVGFVTMSILAKRSFTSTIAFDMRRRMAGGPRAVSLIAANPFGETLWTDWMHRSKTSTCASQSSSPVYRCLRATSCRVDAADATECETEAPAAAAVLAAVLEGIAVSSASAA